MGGESVDVGSSVAQAMYLSEHVTQRSRRPIHHLLL